MKLTYRQVLSRPDADGRCRVVLDVAWDGQRVKLPTGVSCQPAHFRPTARQVILSRDPNATRLNNELTKVETAVSSVFTLASAHSRPVTEAELVLAARAALGKQVAAPPVEAPDDPTVLSFPQLLERWQRECRTAPFNSRRCFNQVAIHLDAFHRGLTLGQPTRAVFQEYQAYLHRLDFAESTISQHVKVPASLLPAGRQAHSRVAGREGPLWPGRGPASGGTTGHPRGRPVPGRLLAA